MTVTTSLVDAADTESRMLVVADPHPERSDDGYRDQLRYVTMRQQWERIAEEYGCDVLWLGGDIGNLEDLRAYADYDFDEIKAVVGDEDRRVDRPENAVEEDGWYTEAMEQYGSLAAVEEDLDIECADRLRIGPQVDRPGGKDDRPYGVELVHDPDDADLMPYMVDDTYADIKEPLLDPEAVDDTYADDDTCADIKESLLDPNDGENGRDGPIAIQTEPLLDETVVLYGESHGMFVQTVGNGLTVKLPSTYKNYGVTDRMPDRSAIVLGLGETVDIWHIDLSPDTDNAYEEFEHCEFGSTADGFEPLQPPMELEERFTSDAVNRSGVLQR